MKTTSTTEAARLLTIAAAGDEARVVALIARAFASDPVARWMYPDDATYPAHFPHVIRGFGGPGLHGGGGYVAASGRAAALLLPPGVHADDAMLDAALRRSILPRNQHDVFSLFEQLAAYHPVGRHYHLAFLVVDPAHQGRGIGGALLAHLLGRCDADGAPVYLESTSLASAGLYERHGFAPLREIRAGSSPPVIPMLREPR